MSDLSMVGFLTSLFTVTVRNATPVLIAAIGLVFMTRSGIVNIGTEGIMLIGALTAVAGSHFTGSVWMGALAATLMGALLGLLFAFVTVTLKAYQMVAGMALNILALGLTSSFDRFIFGGSQALPRIDSFRPVSVPVLQHIPILGPALFNQMAPVYLGVLLVLVSHIILFRTSTGLEIRASGEHPRAAETAGVDVFKVRYMTVISGSALAGFAGAYLSTGIVSFFAENMVAGRGYIALAAVIFGKHTPIGTLLASLLFGAADALQFRLQAMGAPIPKDFLIMLPYVLTIAALVGLVGKATAPAALGRPYARD